MHRVPAKDLAARVSELEVEIAMLRTEAGRHAEEKRMLATENLALLYRARVAEDQLAFAGGGRQRRPPAETTIRLRR